MSLKVNDKFLNYFLLNNFFFIHLMMLNLPMNANLKKNQMFMK